MGEIKNNYKFDSEDKKNSLETNHKINYDALESFHKEMDLDDKTKVQKQIVDIYESTIDEPVPFWTWFILIVVSSFLIIWEIYGSVILLIIFGVIGFFANTKRNLKNFARAMLVVNLIILIIELIYGGIV